MRKNKNNEKTEAKGRKKIREDNNEKEKRGKSF